MTDLIAQVGGLGAEAKAEFFEKALGQLTVAECLTLVKRLEEEWEVEATPNFSGVVPPQPPQEEEVEQTEFDVLVTEIGGQKIKVIREIRGLTEESLKDAKTRLDTLPAVIVKAVSKETADKAKNALEGAGATVEIK